MYLAQLCESELNRPMHMKHDHHDHGPKVVPVTFILEDPEGLTETDQVEWRVMAAVGENILEVALDHHIHMEHTCGGVCACSTCHVYLEEGASEVSEADEDEEDRVEEAPGLQQNSRLACQCCVEGTDPIQIRIPSWNRNAVKEVPH